MGAERLLFTVGLMLMPTAALAAGERMFCCEDAAGHKVCGDPLPQACYNRAYKELSRSGITKRDIEAPMTADERARKNAEDKIKRDAEARLAERRRRDKALIESYESADEIEARRNTTLASANQEIAALRKREQELVDERKGYDARVAAIKKGKPVPNNLKDDISANESELKALRGVIAQKKQEADSIKKRYDEDKARFIELTSGAATQVH
jgi:acyl-CoA synthetase (AMP-forming)/AMP-acid ligase II